MRKYQTLFGMLSGGYVIYRLVDYVGLPKLKWYFFRNITIDLKLSGDQLITAMFAIAVVVILISYYREVHRKHTKMGSK